MSNNNNIVAFRIRKKDVEIQEFLDSLDDSVDISDAIRTCLLVGIREIGTMFPKKKIEKPKENNQENRKTVNEVVQTPKETEEKRPIFSEKRPTFRKIEKEQSEEDAETLGDKLLQLFTSRE